MFVREGAKDRLLSSEQQRFLQQDWPEIKARIERLGIKLTDLVNSETTGGES